MTMPLCPCGSLQAYKHCCQPYHLGKAFAPTATALMQSRYVAFVRRDAEYLHRTWAKDTRPSKKQLSVFSDITWVGLQMIDSKLGSEQDEQGSVTFIAQYVDVEGKQISHREESQFIRDKGKWVYLSGVVDLIE
jgi:SEC-C motif-containing protein